jgi:apolipoprotein N-acyltransferase
MFPEISRTCVKNGAQFLSHLSYENWYGNSCASAQIFTNIALRAIENNVWVVRCVESGISGIVNNKGEIIHPTKLFEEISFAATIYVEKDKELTFYTKYGNWFIWFLLVIIILNIIFRKKNDNTNK